MDLSIMSSTSGESFKEQFNCQSWEDVLSSNSSQRRSDPTRCKHSKELMQGQEANLEQVPT